MSFSLLCAFYWHLVRQTETGYSNFTLALSVAKQGRTLLLFYSTPILAGFKAIFIFGDAALLPFISRETETFVLERVFFGFYVKKRWLEGDGVNDYFSRRGFIELALFVSRETEIFVLGRAFFDSYVKKRWLGRSA